LKQEYAGKVQILFGIESREDPVCGVVEDLMKQFPEANVEVVICDTETGANPKVSKLAHLLRRADYDHLVISDADVLAPPDLLVNLMQPLGNEQVGLVSCLYRQAGAVTAAMQCEAVACNADFWSQVLQSRAIRPMNFALGAVMATRKKQIEEIGGFESIADCLADDYQLGQRIARAGHRIELSPIVVECRSGMMGWSEVWRHQLRWARTIRVCQPLPYFFSILSNGTVWPLLLMVLCHHPAALAAGGLCLVARLITGRDLQRRLLGVGGGKPAPLWMIPLKDILQLFVWGLAFTGDKIDWRDRSFRLRKDGTLRRLDARP
jgi:ceramide glucosyltransferase